ncbi:MAG: hypothetical protein NT061_11210 [Spirochaetes bacterium]|nr:hypothetical protein [Spirochaetota bacterium]
MVHYSSSGPKTHPGRRPGRRFIPVTLIAVLLAFAAVGVATAQATSAAPVGSAPIVSAPTAIEQIVSQAAQGVKSLTESINILWMLLAGFLVFFMQAGFALVETGFTRHKNVAHTMMMNMIVFCIGAI